MDEIRTDLPVVDVTLFEDRARVKRAGFVELPEGLSKVTISSVSPVISDRTLSAGIVDNSLSLGSLSVHRSLRGPDDLTGEIARIEADLDVMRSAFQELADKHSAAGTKSEIQRRILELTSAEIPGDIAAGHGIEEAKQSKWESLDEESGLQSLEQLNIETEMEDLQSSIDDLEILLDVKRTPSTLCDASLHADVRADAPGNYSLEIEYIVPASCWRPGHKAFLTGDSLHFETEACVWQNTGEDWDNVSLSFSTHRPSLGTRPPVLSDDRISLTRKGKEDVVEIREQSIGNTGLGSSGSVSGGSAEVPGVDDGGTVRTFTASSPASIPSDGRPYRVKLGSFDSKADLDIIAMPELSPFAFGRSVQVNTAEYPLLAGPVELIRQGGHIGRTSVLYMAPGEKFALGWGPDPDLRIHRSESTRSREAGGLNAWDKTEYNVDIRISNIGPELKKMTVRERIPVSEIERVRVKLDEEASSDMFGKADADGMVESDIKIEPSGRQHLKLVYHMETHKKVVSS